MLKKGVLSEDFNQTGRPKRDEKGPFVPFCAPFVPFGEERPVLATFLSRFARKPLAGCPVYRANGMAQMCFQPTLLRLVCVFCGRSY